MCLGNGLGFAPCSSVYVSPTAYGLATQGLTLAGDFNGDGKADVLVVPIFGPCQLCSPSGGYPLITMLGNGDGTFQNGVLYGSPQSFPAYPARLPMLVISDMNGDGKSDIAEIAGIAGSGVLLSNGDGTFTPAATLPQGQTSLAAADFNNDRLTDLVVTSADTTTILINTTVGVTSVVNAASLAQNQPVAPGSMVTIFGAGLGPVGQGFSVGGASLPDSIGGFSVTFNGIPAPLSYVSARQINAQVPWEIQSDAEVVVTANGVSTAPFKVSTAAIAPGIFVTTSGQAFASIPMGQSRGRMDRFSGFRRIPHRRVIP